MEPIVGQFARIFAVEPVQLVWIKRCVTAHNLVEVENINDLVDRNFLPIVFRRPAEQAEIIANRFRQKPPLNIIVHARALISFAHLGAIPVQN